MKVCSITYHEVVNNPFDSGIQRESALPYKHSINEFRSHINIFNNNKIITPKINEIDLDNKGGVSHIITFDDGGISNLKAAELLEEYGLIGHFLVTTDFIGQKGFLSKGQIQDLNKRGHVIGSHSKTHPDIFYNLSLNQMVDEWKISKNILEEIIGEKISCASIPGGEMNNNAWQSSAEAGISYLFCSEPFFKPIKNENWLLGRVCPKVGSRGKKINNFINFRGYGTEMGIRKVKNIVKRVYYPLQEILKF